MIVYGSRATHASSHQLKNIPCTNCGEQTGYTMSFFAKYGHVFWIPMFPIGKVSVAECNSCKRTFAEEEYSETLLGCRTELKPRAKSPIWNWAGLMIIGLIFLGSTFFEAVRYHDPREKLLAADIEEMTQFPSLETDSISLHVKMFMDMILHEDMTPERIKYRTAINDNAALFLMKIPDLGDVESSERPEIMQWITSMIENEEVLAGKDKYYAVMNNSDRVMLAKSPTDSSYSSFADEAILYDFYGLPLDE